MIFNFTCVYHYFITVFVAAILGCTKFIGNSAITFILEDEVDNAKSGVSFNPIQSTPVMRNSIKIGSRSWASFI